MTRISDIDMTDPRLRDPRFEGANNGGKGRLLPGADLLRRARVVEAIRAGEQQHLTSDSEWRQIGARCDCGAPVEFAGPGMEWPVCAPCMSGAVSLLALLDADAKVTA